MLTNINLSVIKLFIEGSNFFLSKIIIIGFGKDNKLSHAFSHYVSTQTKLMLKWLGTRISLLLEVLPGAVCV